MRGGHPRERGGVQEAHVQHAGLQVVYIVPFFFLFFFIGPRLLGSHAALRGAPRYK